MCITFGIFSGIQIVCCVCLVRCFASDNIVLSIDDFVCVISSVDVFIDGVNFVISFYLVSFCSVYSTLFCVDISLRLSYISFGVVNILFSNMNRGRLHRRLGLTRINLFCMDSCIYSTSTYKNSGQTST